MQIACFKNDAIRMSTHARSDSSPLSTYDTGSVNLANITLRRRDRITLSIGGALPLSIVSGHLQGKTETATLYVLRALEERQDQAGYLVALTLAGISVVLLAAIEVFKRKRVKETST